MAESLFTSQTPTNGNASDGPPGLVTATAMWFAAAGQITHIRFWCPDNSDGTWTGKVWRVTAGDPGGGTGTQLASAVASSPTPGGWNTIALASPVTVIPNTALYKIAIHNTDGRFVMTPNFPQFVGGSGGLANGNIRAPFNGDEPVGGGLNVYQGSYVASATADYPNQPGSASNYFVDVLFDAAVTASAGVATGSGMANNAGVGVVVAAGSATAAASSPSSVGTPTFFSDADVSGAGETSEAEVWLATEFTVPAGTINSFRWRFPAGAIGVTPVVRLYDAGGTAQAIGPGGATTLSFDSTAADRWNNAIPPAPIAVVAGTYRVVVNTTRYMFRLSFFTSPIVRGSITGVQSRFGSPGSAPASTSTATYLIDLGFTSSTADTTVSAGNAAGAGAAADPTPGVVVQADAATAAGAAHDAGALTSRTAAPELAAAVADAMDAAAATASGAGAAGSVAAAWDGAVSAAVVVSVAAAAAAAEDAVGAAAVVADVPVAAGAAADAATVLVAVPEPAGAVGGAGQAAAGTVVPAGEAVAAGAAFPATVTSVDAVVAAAQVAAADGSAYAGDAAVVVAAEDAAAVGAAHQAAAQTSSESTGPADVAVAVAAAVDAGAVLVVSVEAATAVGAAHPAAVDAADAVTVSAAAAVAAAEAFDVASGLVALADLAAAVGAALDGQVSTPDGVTVAVGTVVATTTITVPPVAVGATVRPVTVAAVTAMQLATVIGAVGVVTHPHRINRSSAAATIRRTV